MGLIKWLFSNNLKGKRIQTLRSVRNALIETARKMERNPGDANPRYYSSFRRSVESTPVFFVPGKALAVQRHKNGISAIFGENVVKVFFEQKGKETKIKKENYIVLPSGHLFYKEKITKKGLLTLIHEYAHLKGRVGEHIADAIMMNIALKMEIPRKDILRHFSGRSSILGGLYPLYIKKIMHPEKAKKGKATRIDFRPRKPQRRRVA